MWDELVEYARRAPSPHNTQPTRLHVVDPHRAELYFVAARGLPVGDPEGRFTQLTFGIFVESLRIAAHARGFQLHVDYAGESLYREGVALAKVADLHLRPLERPADDLDPSLILQRRTNRHPYNGRPIPPAVINELCEEAQRYGHEFHTSTDESAIRWVRELNRDSLYHDLAHPEYRRELAAWLRYSEREACRTRDGLSPGAMVLPGWAMKGMMRAHRLFTAPVIRPATQQLYMRTMTGISTVGWIKGDFAGSADWTAAGHLMLRLWLILTRHGVDWQPYGSIITNDAARRSMTQKFGMHEGTDGHDMVWLLVRMGYSDHAPVRSQRLETVEVVA